MNAIRRSVLIAVCLLTAVAARVDAQSTTEVYGVTLSATASFQFLMDPPAVASFKITQDTVINLAQGRASTAVVPANEVLALLFSEEEEAVLVVFDTATTNVLVTVAETDDSRELANSKGGVIVTALDIESNGNETNGLADGKLYLEVAFTQKETDPVAKIKGSFFGFVDAVNGGNFLPLVLSKGKLGTTGRIAVIVAE